MNINPEELTIEVMLRLVLGATTLVPLASLFLLALVAGSQLRGGAVTGVVLTLLVGTVAVVGATIFLYHLLSRKISERVLDLIDVCRNYAGGDRTIRARVSGDDLFALLAQILNTLLDSQELDEGEDDVRRHEEYRISAQQVQVERLLHEVRSVAQGDLPLQSGVTSQTLGMLADSFAYLIEGFSQAIKQVHLSAVQVHQETLLIQDTSAELDEEGREQIASLAHLTHEVEATAVFLQQVARNVQVGAESAESIMEHAQQGKASLHEALAEMTSVQHAVGDTARTISHLRMGANEIYETFTQLSDVVTHAELLAQNAALQATLSGGGEARQASDLAEDIQRLVNRTQSVRTRLASLFGRLQDEAQGAEGALDGCLREVAQGVRRVEEAGRGLSELALETGRSAHLYRQFTRETDVQAEHFTSVAGEHALVAGQMEATHQRHEEVARSIEVLAHLNEQLHTFVSTIKLPDVPFSIEQDRVQPSSEESHRLV